MVVTNSAIYVVEEKDGKLKDRITFQQLQGLSVTSLTDGLLVLRTPSEIKKEKGDLILNCDYVIEAVVNIISTCNNKSLLKIETGGSIPHNIASGKQGMIEASSGTSPIISKGKNGHLVVIAASP
jgi:myosin-1